MIKISVGPMDNNAYLLQPREGAGVLIDAANDTQRLLGIIAGEPVATIITTHRHSDHSQALAAVAAETGARLWPELRMLRPSRPTPASRA